MGTAAQLFTKSMLIGLDSSLQKKQFDDEDLISDIENLPYEEAVEYLSKRSILKKDDYYKLSDKLKFRAFTVGRINDGRLLDKLNAEMIKNVNDGKGLKDFLALTKTDILNKIGMGPNQGWYWETVYRTNVQTAYNVGRAMGFEKDPPIALEFVGVDDARQTDTCSSLSGVIRPYDDPFWEGHTPPLHFKCRSTLRGIYDESELPDKWSNVGDVENAAKGFGSWPTENDSWWEELASQTRAAKYYGVQGEIEKAKKVLIDENRKEDLIKEATKQIEKINTNHKELVDEVSEIFKKQALIKDSPEHIREFLLKQLESFDDDQLALLKKYADTIQTEIKVGIEVSEYNGVKIILKSGSQAVDYYHELGHYIDDILTGEKRIRETLPNFLETLHSDALAWVNKNSGEKAISSFEKIPRKVAEKINDIIRIREGFDKYDEVSDIMEGLTKGKIGGYDKCGSGHGVYYMTYKAEETKHIEGECIAHFTNTWFRYKFQSAEGTKEVFPNAYKMYIDYLRGKING